MINPGSTRGIALIPLLCLLLSLTGCGMEAVDTRVQFPNAAGDPYDHQVQMPEGKYVCPNIVRLDGKPFDTKDILLEDGQEIDQIKLDGAFGPYVQCNNLLDSDTGTCSKCGQSYSGGGDAGDQPVEDSKTVAVSPQPAFVCPYEDCGKVISVGSNALERETGKDAVPGQAHCWHCKRNVSFVAKDALLAIDQHQSMLCPSCKNGVDPTLNVCTTSSCKLKGKLLNANPVHGPCWLCGGMALCPDCSGAGKGTSGVFGKTPAECWICKDTGRCPECDADGFCVYEGVVPSGFKFFKGKGDNLENIPHDKRNWQLGGKKQAKGAKGEDAE